MILHLKQFVNSLKNPSQSPFAKGRNIKLYLIIANIFLVFFLILLSNLKVIPFKATGDFIFFACLVLAFALYRPGWAFLFLVGTIALENINLAPESLGFFIRPYQFIGGLLFLAVAIRFLSERLYFQPVKLNWPDWLVFLIPLASLLHIFNSANPKAGIKFTLILFSFSILFLLAKNYIQNVFDLKKVLPFFFGSSLVIMLYGFWQNIRFAQGMNSFAVMPGRPNGTFTEPDWMGLYLSLLLAGIYSLMFYFSKKSCEANKDAQIYNLQFTIYNKFSIFKFLNFNFISNFKFQILNFIYLTLVFALLIISVARSAWLAAISVTIIFLFIVFTNLKINFRQWQWRETIKIKLYVIFAFIISLGAVYFFHLTTFQLFNRVVSTGGMQKITVSCDVDCGVGTGQCPVPTRGTINATTYSISELAQFGCRHINLEEIEQEKVKGNIVTEIYRKDPNVNTRVEIYRKAWVEIKARPILGIGWENIGAVLGRDGRGVSLNSSNIFLETWLGSGIIGFVGLTIILGNILIQALISFYKEQNIEQKTFALFIILSWVGIIIFNLFNAGIMLGFFWVWLGIASGLKYENRH